MSEKNIKKRYALILGVSSGFGRAIAIELAKKNFNIYGVHLDIGTSKKAADDLENELKNFNIKVKFFNMNAAEDANRQYAINAILDDLKDEPESQIDCVIHSLAFGAIGPLFADTPGNEIRRKKMEMTLDVMANSLLYWTQDLLHAKLLRRNSRIFGMTSIGSSQAMINYGALSIAKAALEAYIRQIAVELAPLHITANGILAGITDTPAGRKIPHFDQMLEYARRQNPHKRNTVPEDVARVIALLVEEDAYWITGNIINVDGGENIANFFE